MKILFVVAQVHDGVQNQLSRAMVGDLPTTFCAYQWIRRLLRIESQVVGRTALTKGKDWWVLQQNDRATVARTFCLYLLDSVFQYGNLLYPSLQNRITSPSDRTLKTKFKPVSQTQPMGLRNGGHQDELKHKSDRGMYS